MSSTACGDIALLSGPCETTFLYEVLETTELFEVAYDSNTWRCVAAEIWLMLFGLTEGTTEGAPGSSEGVPALLYDTLALRPVHVAYLWHKLHRLEKATPRPACPKTAALSTAADRAHHQRPASTARRRLLATRRTTRASFDGDCVRLRWRRRRQSELGAPRPL